jgi:23S rRNA pseudouridine2605 synthase
MGGSIERSVDCSIASRSVIIPRVKERIQKVLAGAGIASRRNVEEMIRQGRISVNGRVVVDLPVLIDPERDKVAIDDEKVPLREAESAEKIYVLMNKPKDVYTTNVAQGEQRRAIDLLPPGFPRVYPVGRLDAESRGLLLLTNDGDLTNLLTHPRYGVLRTYKVVVDGLVNSDRMKELEQGVWLSDPKTGRGFKTGRTVIKVINRNRQKSVLEVTLRERNREVRRMLARIGHKVRDLTRIRMGPLTLGALSPGEFRPLTGKEIRQLYEAGKPREKTGAGKDAAEGTEGEIAKGAAAPIRPGKGGGARGGTGKAGMRGGRPGAYAGKAGGGGRPGGRRAGGAEGGEKRGGRRFGPGARG